MGKGPVVVVTLPWEGDAPPALTGGELWCKVRVPLSIFRVPLGKAPEKKHRTQ